MLFKDIVKKRRRFRNLFQQTYTIDHEVELVDFENKKVFQVRPTKDRDSFYCQVTCNTGRDVYTGNHYYEQLKDLQLLNHTEKVQWFTEEETTVEENKKFTKTLLIMKDGSRIELIHKHHIYKQTPNYQFIHGNINYFLDNQGKPVPIYDEYEYQVVDDSVVQVKDGRVCYIDDKGIQHSLHSSEVFSIQVESKELDEKVTLTRKKRIGNFKVVSICKKP